MSRIQLPAPKVEGRISVERAIAQRRSRRSFARTPLTAEQVGQLLWAAQGITDAGGRKRAAPSAGATYPMVLFIMVGQKTADELEAGIYRYLPAEHALESVLTGDLRAPLAEAALGQEFIAEAPMTILMAADYARTTGRYGERGRRYVDMEAGHIGQNVYLQCEALGLATVAVGAFRDAAVAQIFRLPSALVPLYLMPVGHPR